jgi:hypothetical protein
VTRHTPHNSAPRSASVRAMGDCTLWSLHREAFREVQAVTSSEALVARTNALNALEALAPVDRFALAQLAGALTTLTVHEQDAPLVVQGEALQRYGCNCLLLDQVVIKCISVARAG